MDIPETPQTLDARQRTKPNNKNTTPKNKKTWDESRWLWMV